MPRQHCSRLALLDFKGDVIAFHYTANRLAKRPKDL